MTCDLQAKFVVKLRLYQIFIIYLYYEDGGGVIRVSGIMLDMFGMFDVSEQY